MTLENPVTFSGQMITDNDAQTTKKHKEQEPRRSMLSYIPGYSFIVSKFYPSRHGESK